MAARIVVADDHPLFVEELVKAIADTDVDVVGSTGRGDEVLGLVSRTSPDVLLVEASLCRRDGSSCLAAARRAFPDLKVIVVSGDDRPEMIERALDLGAVCFLGSSITADDILHAVRLVTDSPPSVIYPSTRAEAGASRTRAAETGMTKREREILQLVVEGRSNAQVAQMLWVTEQTVKFHLSNIYRKLGVRNRTQAAAKARGLGLLSERGGAARSDRCATC